MKRRLAFITQCVLCLSVIFSCCRVLSSAEQRPNVLVVLSDDQGWGDLSLNGNTNLSTPRIDSLARGGAQFDRFFVCPVCSPTRAEFLTGRYHPRCGVYSTSTGGERMNLNETTIAQSFHAAGYATAIFGKWHNGEQYPYHPKARGFDEFFGFCSGHYPNYYFTGWLDRLPKDKNHAPYLEDLFTDQALDFIQQHERHPFFAYVAFNSPHSPMQVPDEYWNRFKDKPLVLHATNAKREDIDHTRAALAMCENLDWNVGRMLDRLHDLGLQRRTIVVYFCDNGPNGHRWNGGMKGIKGSTDEGGVRSPLLIRWPESIQPGTRVTEIAGAIDLFPTLHSLCGLAPLAGKRLDGLDLAPVLVPVREPTKERSADQRREIRERMIFSYWNGSTSVRTQQYRLDRDGKLFDVTADPGQRVDVSKKHEVERNRLANAVKKWNAELLPLIARDERPFLVGHPQDNVTMLVAADGKPHGNIRRPSPHPNSSYFTNWTSADDSITWDVEVLTAGEYEASIAYTCPAKDVGSRVELSVGDRQVGGEIHEAHDPPLIGAEHDRVPRTEAYAKEFRWLDLGTIELEKGRGALKLRAKKIPGAQVGDIRAVRLSRGK